MDDQGPLIVNLPALTSANCMKHLDESLVPNCARDVDAATTDSNGNNTDVSIMSEEFECGVSVSGPETDRQEWSFTLYDFDGQGNITKEDLATLLKTLYDAVGVTVSKQRQNTKSLRLRLTLSPDASQQTAAVKPSSSPAADNSNKAHSYGCAAPDHSGCGLGSKDMKVKMNNLLQSDKVIGERLRNGRTADIMTRNNVSSQSAAIRTAAKDVHLASSPARDNKAFANACAVNFDSQVSDEAAANSNNNSRRMLRSRRCVSSHFDNPDRRNYYLDLAGVREADNVHVMMERNMAAGIAAVASPRVSRQQAKRSQQQHVDKDASRFVVKMPTSRSAEHCQQRDISCNKAAAVDGGGSKRDNDNNKESISNESRLGNRPDDCTTRVAREAKRPTHRLRCASCSAAAGARIREQAYIMQESLSASASPQHKVDVGQTTAAATTSAEQNNSSSSHYHHRHKNRARNQTRAMRQVMDWLEDAGKPAASLPPRELVVIQRHEHHHIHEYHHHHYHHYDEKKS